MSDPAVGARPALKGFQRQYLKALAHELKPLVQVGQQGVTDEVVAATNRALADHELIKVRLHEPEDKHAMAAALADRCGAVLCAMIGHTMILYRPHPKEPRIRIPERKGPVAS